MTAPRALVLCSFVAWSAAVAQSIGPRDLESLVTQAELVARVRITSAALPSTEAAPPVYRAKLITPIKGNVPSEIQIIGEGRRPPRYATGDDELVFLTRPREAAAQAPPTFASIQAGNERWDGATFEPGVEAFLKGILAVPPGDTGRIPRFNLYLAAARSTVPRLAAQASARLAAFAVASPLNTAELERLSDLVIDEAVPGRNRASLVTAMSSAFPAKRAVELLPRVKDPSTRAALLAAAAQTDTPADTDRARSALGAGRGADSPDESMAAAVGLATLGDEAALPTLREFLMTGDAQQRIEVVSALASLARRGSHDARVELKVLREDPDRRVAASAGQLYDDLLASSPERLARRRSGIYLALGAGLLLAIALFAGVKGFASRVAARSKAKA